MDTNKYKIGIIGLGPIGQVLAVHFKQAGCEVALCDVDNKKTSLIRSEGINLIGKIEKAERFRYVYDSIDSLLDHDFDLLISAVKAYHVDSVLKCIEKHTKNNMFLLSAQNGIDIREIYLDHFKESQILRMVVNFAGVQKGPNFIDVTFFNPPNYVGSVNDTQPEIAKWIAKILTGVNLETNFGDSFDISDRLWAKTILNAALSPLCGIAKLTMKEAMEHPDTLEIVEQIIYEAVEVARAEDVKIPDNFVKKCIRYLKMAGHHFPSLAVDLINKRPTEINFMNGKIVEYGRKHYIKTPLNLTLTNLVYAISHKNGKSQD